MGICKLVYYISGMQAVWRLFVVYFDQVYKIKEKDNKIFIEL